MRLAGDRSSHDGEMNQNTPNPGLTLKFPNPPFFAYLMKWRGCPRISIFDDEWYRTPKSDCRQGTEMGESAPRIGYILNLKRVQDKTLGETGESDRLQVQTGGNWREHFLFSSHTTWIHHGWVWLQGNLDLGGCLL